MKRLLLLLPLILFFACNGPTDTKPATGDSLIIDPSDSTHGEISIVSKERPMKFSAVLPSGQQYDILANGDSMFYKTKDTTVTISTPYTYKVNYKELHPKGTVTPPVNQAPIARAGNDATITLPVSSVQLNATASTDPEGQTLKFYWRQTAGPAQATLVDSNKAICTASNLKAGSYQFEVRAVDPLNAFTADYVTITVKPEVVTPPGGSPVPFSFTAIPFSDPDLNAPGRGVEQWHSQNTVNIPTEGTNTQRLDVYYRLTWFRIEKAKDQYDWSYVINILNTAISKRQKVSLGLMSVYHDNEDGVGNYDGGFSSYPEYLHNLMKAEGVKDWKKNYGSSSGWVPNYNSSNYIARLRALNASLNNLLETGSNAGVRYKDVINEIDIRGYGNYGEWHNGGIVNQISEFPSGTFPTSATLKAIIDAHTQTIPNFQLVIIMTAFDYFLQHTKTSPEVGYYALTTKNNYGPIGWRRDNWGAGDGTGDTYIDDLLIDNVGTWNGTQLKTLIMKVWEKAPVTGEPMNSTSNNFTELEAQVRKYHATSFGNGNITTSPNSTIKNSFRAASKAAGYRLVVPGGTFTVGSNSISITTNWQNVGIAPTYENWNINYEVVSSTGAITPLGVSDFKLRLFLPGNVMQQTDVFPLNISGGNYTLRMVVKDPNGYRAPLPLAIQGRNSDGSYNIKTFQR